MNEKTHSSNNHNDQHTHKNIKKLTNIGNPQLMETITTITLTITITTITIQPLTHII